MNASLLKNPFLYVLVLGLAGFFVKTKFPQFLPLSFGGSEYSPLETKARQFAKNAGEAISTSCNNSGNEPTIKFLGFNSLKNDRLKIHVQVSWEGIIGIKYMVKGWVTCDENGLNPNWQVEKNAGLLMPECYDKLPESLE